MWNNSPLSEAHELRYTHVCDFDIAVNREHGGIAIYIKGYGANGMAEGYGPPIYIELDKQYHPHPRVFVWSDINEGDPVVVELDKAREELYKGEESDD